MTLFGQESHGVLGYGIGKCTSLGEVHLVDSNCLACNSSWRQVPNLGAHFMEMSAHFRQPYFGISGHLLFVVYNKMQRRKNVNGFHEERTDLLLTDISFQAADN